MKRYQQCLLRFGDAEQVAWIEARGAQVGAQVELLPSHEFWQVAEVYGHSLAEDQLREMQRQHRGSLPSVKGKS